MAAVVLPSVCLPHGGHLVLINVLKGFYYWFLQKQQIFTQKMFSSKRECIETVELTKLQIFSFRHRVIEEQFVIFSC